MIKHSCCNFQKENGFREIVENLKADAVKMANEYGNNRILGNLSGSAWTVYQQTGEE